MKNTAQKVHDRRSTDHPTSHGSRIVERVVEDPYNGRDKIAVVISTRDNPLADMWARGQIDRAQFEAGKKWQRAFEIAEIGVCRNGFKSKVDNGGSSAGDVEDEVATARKRLMKSREYLGSVGYQLLSVVLGEGRRLIDVVAEQGGNCSPDSADQKYVGRRFRECLEQLVASTSSKGSVSFMFPSRKGR
jgi:hypothetical protein